MISIGPYSCGLADDFDIHDDLPASYLGSWEETSGIKVELNANSITYDGNYFEFEVVSKLPNQGSAVFGADTDDPDFEADFYFKQPNGVDQLEISLTNAPDDFITYFRPLD